MIIIITVYLRYRRCCFDANFDFDMKNRFQDDYICKNDLTVL